MSELSNSKDEAKRDRIRFVWSVRPFLSSISIPVVSSQPRVIKLKGSVISLNVAARWLGCVLKGHPANMSVLSGWSHAWNCEYTDRMANRGSVYRTEKTGQRFLPPNPLPPSPHYYALGIVLFHWNIRREGAFRAAESRFPLEILSPRPSTTLFPARLSKAPGIKLYRISASLRVSTVLSTFR